MSLDNVIGLALAAILAIYVVDASYFSERFWVSTASAGVAFLASVALALMAVRMPLGDYRDAVCVGSRASKRSHPPRRRMNICERREGQAQTKKLAHPDVHSRLARGTGHRWL